MLGLHARTPCWEVALWLRSKRASPPPLSNWPFIPALQCASPSQAVLTTELEALDTWLPRKSEEVLGSPRKSYLHGKILVQIPVVQTLTLKPE